MEVVDVKRPRGGGKVVGEEGEEIYQARGETAVPGAHGRLQPHEGDMGRVTTMMCGCAGVMMTHGEVWACDCIPYA